MRTEAEWSEMRERYRQGVSISRIAMEEGQARGRHSDGQEASQGDVLDAPDEGEVSLSRIQPRRKSCVDERVIRIEAGP